MTESPIELDEDLVQRWSEVCAATLETLAGWATVSKVLRSERKHMIRIRTKPAHVTVRVGDEPKQRFTSAIHALHVIRVAVVEQGMAIEDTAKTQQALAACITRARDELEAAIWDVDLSQRERAVCTMRQTDDGGVETSLYQTTDHRHLKVIHHWRFEVWEDEQCIRHDGPKGSRYVVNSADDAIRALGYMVAPGDV